MSKSLKEIVRDNVRYYAHENNIKTSALYVIIGGQTITNILHPEKSKGGCTVSTLEKLAKMLEVSVVDLVTDRSDE